MIRPLAAALALCASASALPAHADDVADAKARFKKGVELYREQRWREAVAEFEAAYRLKPHGAIHFNVAQCRERLEDWPGAHRSYHDYLREVPDAGDRVAVRASLKRIEERLASAGVQALLVHSDPPGARVAIDGRDRGTTPFQAVLAPGSYALVLVLDGHEPLREQLELSPSAATIVDVTLRRLPRAPPAAEPAATVPPDLSPRPPATAPPIAPPRPPHRPRRQLAAWIAGGTAVAALAAGAYFGWSARRDERALKALGEPDGGAAGRRARDAESKARTANALYAIGGGAAAAGATLFVLEARF
jgi:tetratricopeptide (TPR) repeat protein